MISISTHAHELRPQRTVLPRGFVRNDGERIHRLSCAKGFDFVSDSASYELTVTAMENLSLWQQ